METKELRNYACRDRRDLPIDLCDLKFDTTKGAAANDSVSFNGYASKWDRVDSYGDTIKQGSFADSLKARRPIMLYGHNPSKVIGKFTQVKEDKTGLYVEGETTPGNSEAQNVAASLKHGALNGLSIGGYTTKWENTNDAQGYGRIIKAFDLYEISAVSMPAEQEARIDTASVKSMLDECNTVSDLEALLREVSGFSNKMATAFIARLRRAVQGEPGREEPANKGASELLDLMRSSEIPQSILSKG